MVDVIIDPRTYKVSKIPIPVIAKVAEAIKHNPSLKSPKAKKKWLEVVDLDGERFGVSCHETSGAIEITSIKRLKKRKSQPWRE